MKADKGAAAAKKESNVKPKVKGGNLKIAKHGISKVGSLASKISKFTPGGKADAAKKSVGGKGKFNQPTPGGDSSGGATTDVRTMSQFKKFVKAHQRMKQGRK